MTRFADSIECEHCGAEVEIPLREIEGERDHWLFDDETLRCTHCGRINHVMVDDHAYFTTCEDPCPVCDVLTACSEVLDGPIDLDRPAGDSLARCMVEMEVERALDIDIPEADRDTWRTPRELAVIVERVMGGRACAL